MIEASDLVGRRQLSDAISVFNEIDGKGCGSDSTMGIPGLVVWFFLIFWTFCALAIVCDEFFVGALDAIVDRLGLSEDVAGATFMAIGSSAPEFFTAFIGVFFFSEGEDPGPGTIVGSAVFNISVIIGLTAVMSPPMTLFWWPLLRDSTFYAISIVLLLLFMSVISEKEIEVWEGAVLTVVYVLYILFMTINGKVVDYIKTKWPPPARNSMTTSEKSKTDEVAIDDGRSHSNSVGERLSVPVEMMSPDSTSSRLKDRRTSGSMAGRTRRNSWQGNIATKYKKFNSDDVEKISPAKEHKASSSSSDTGEHADNGGGKGRALTLDHHTVISGPPPITVTSSTLSGSLNTTTTTTTGAASNPPVTVMTSTTMTMLTANSGNTRSSANSTSSSVISTSKVQLDAPSPSASPSPPPPPPPPPPPSAPIPGGVEIDEEETQQKARENPTEQKLLIIKEAPSSEEPRADSRDDNGGNVDGKVEDNNNADAEEDGPMHPALKLVSTLYDIITWPIMKTFEYTIPDCRKPRWADYYFMTFAMSIFWIGFVSFFMVDGANKAGACLGLSANVMGLTFLAAGTSVPDALSSILVAREGFGDMAVSNAVGSNVFDILIGLGTPWMIYGIINDKSYPINTEGTLEYVLVLFGLLIALIGLLVMTSFRLDNRIGYLLLSSYLGFIVFSLAYSP